MLTGVDENFRERCEKPARRRRRNLGRVDRSNHESITHAYSGHKPAHHEKGIVGGEPHEKSSDEEYGGGEYDGVTPANPIWRFSSSGGADEGVQIEYSDEDLDLHVGHFEVIFDVDWCSTHYSNI